MIIFRLSSFLKEDAKPTSMRAMIDSRIAVLLPNHITKLKFIISKHIYSLNKIFTLLKRTI
ncbi:hypothetical protein GCM10007941_07100 [Amphritea balenae]|nr:hypothetical protein GCM10007941_07100 [Amphritea balenae]